MEKTTRKRQKFFRKYVPKSTAKYNKTITNLVYNGLCSKM